MKTERKSVSSAQKLDGLGKIKSMHFVLNMFTRTLVTYAKFIFMPRCCLAQLSKYAHASGIYLYCA